MATPDTRRWWALAISLLLHLAVVWGGWRWMAIRAAQELATLEARGARQPLYLIDLQSPANRIRPTRARFIGVEPNTTSEETVAVTPPAPRGRVSTPREVPKRSPSPPLMGIGGALPATAMVERVRGGAGLTIPEDFFPNYRRGPHTYVNVLQHPHIDYFVALKRSLKIAWDPVPVIRRHDHQLLVERGNLRVVLGVAVDATGQLQELFVLQGSGIATYDTEALRAFRATFPFFAPPPQLLAMDGGADQLLRMSWSFVVYL